VDVLLAEFGRLVRATRLDAGLTQAQLGEAVGLTRTSIANIEAGRQRAFIDTAYRIADAVNCPPHELLPDPATLRAEADLPPDVERQPLDVQKWIRDVAAESSDTEGNPTNEEGRPSGTSDA
jgi:transcriptional regulator with XRE-family HTH domain